MVLSEFTHTSVLATDLEESVAFYEELFGMERVPSPRFSVPVEWLRCGDRTLHLFKREMEAADFYHVGIHVDDFESVYRKSVERGLESDFDSAGDEPVVYELPDGAVQFYIDDPAGNLVEVNYPNVDELDTSIVSNVIKRADQLEQTGDAADAKLYFENTTSAIEPRE
ncbi:VOC family protein [Natrarchaeobius oligotrophus]|uniref:VOC family protein n=1 Tax=Natrarchaeobius chitinivorans TaxID=1679083 RepID=A0A3N6MSU7_NATCH|nr:VOC family protein [Natrarchaeobius chitinivorans]RQG99401.1 VOC family protein [Natrarchaeobius chitinivorans]